MNSLKESLQWFSGLNSLCRIKKFRVEGTEYRIAYIETGCEYVLCDGYWIYKPDFKIVTIGDNGFFGELNRPKEFPLDQEGLSELGAYVVEIDIDYVEGEIPDLNLIYYRRHCYALQYFHTNN